MAYWLMKSEPGSWSWDQQVKSGAKGEPGPACATSPAKPNLMKMKKGDRAFFYHSGEDKAVVGIVEVVARSLSRPDRRKRRALGRGRRQGGRAAAEAGDARGDQGRAEAERRWRWSTYTRLSVQPVTAEEWKLVCKMGGLK